MFPASDNGITVAAPPSRPTVHFPEDVFESSLVTFTCSGFPGYPDGALEWKVKSPQESSFRDFVFFSEKKNITDRNCVRHEEKNVTFSFSKIWNGTVLRCQAENTDLYDEVEILVVPGEGFFPVYRY